MTEMSVLCVRPRVLLPIWTEASRCCVLWALGQTLAGKLPEESSLVRRTWKIGEGIVQRKSSGNKENSLDVCI